MTRGEKITVYSKWPGVFLSYSTLTTAVVSFNKRGYKFIGIVPISRIKKKS